MGGIVFLVLLFMVFGAVLGVIAFVAYRRVLRKAKGVERGLKMVPLLIHLPPPSDDTENSGNRDVRDVMREKINQAQVLYDLIAGTAQSGFKSMFYGQRHIAFEIVANNGLVHYFAAVPIALVAVVEQAIVTAYPGARLEEVEDHNIFNPQGRLTGTVGGELVLRHEAAYPIAMVDQMERDPMSGLINALYKLQMGDGAAVQIMLRPAGDGWTKRAIKLVSKKRHTRQGGLGFGALDVAKAAVKTSEEWRERAKTFEPSKLEEDTMQAIEEKTKHPGYEVLIRVVASSPSFDRSQILLRSITTSFALFEAPGSNGFQFIEGRDMQGLITAFIFRFFPPELTSNVLNSVELATVFHLPDAQFTPTTQVERQQSKQVDGPANMPQTGLLLGYNFYRGVKKEIRLSGEDRRRHAYFVGQTGTGKSTMLENLAVQDMLNGGGFAFIDPHGDTAEKLLSMVPKERAEDVIYFNPADMEQPLGINLFEYDRPEQKDFLIQESINMLYKLYDPQKTGIIGPRFEHWYRQAALTLMADPHGASFIEIPKVFTDTGYLKTKFKYLNDPSVIDFWTKEMGQTSDYHKSEMLGWFVSKFGAFQSNEMMRNIIGQTKSGFNLRDIMDNKKILIVNLSKGQVGELNSQLLGMIFVIKIQAAAMSRAAVPEDQRPDFCLYVDEFQNFSTDSFASILSEARKYHLNLVVANQFIGQLTDEIRDAVFGNIGTMLSYRCGPEDAEFLVKQFEPIFDQRDLVNLPNHNAIMKLLIGGLPSQPFSITALPPLGIAHPELGLAIKQLSAAKYGVSRQVVEADIFARLQNQPRTVTPNAATAPMVPAAAPAAPGAPAAPVAPTAPVATTPPVAAPPAPVAPEPVTALPSPLATPAAAPVTAPSPAPVAPAVMTPPPAPTPPAPVEPPAVPPTPVPTPEPTPPAPEPASAPTEDIHAAMLPPTSTPAAAPAAPADQAPVTPKPATPPSASPPAPSGPGELSLTNLRATAPSPTEEASPALELPTPPKPKPEPIPEPSKEEPKEKDTAPKRIEAHETDGKVAPPKPVQPNPPQRDQAPRPQKPRQPLRIEAHEADGRVSSPPNKPAQPQPQPQQARREEPRPPQDQPQQNQSRPPKPPKDRSQQQSGQQQPRPPQPQQQQPKPRPTQRVIDQPQPPAKTMIASHRTRPPAPPQPAAPLPASTPTPVISHHPQPQPAPVPLPAAIPKPSQPTPQSPAITRHPAPSPSPLATKPPENQPQPPKPTSLKPTPQPDTTPSADSWTPPSAGAVTDAYAAAAVPNAAAAAKSRPPATKPASTVMPSFDLPATSKGNQKKADQKQSNQKPKADKPGKPAAPTKPADNSLWSPPSAPSEPPAPKTPPTDIAPGLALTSLQSVDFTRADSSATPSEAPITPLATPTTPSAAPIISSASSDSAPAAGSMVEPDPAQAESKPILSPSSVAHPGDADASSGDGKPAAASAPTDSAAPVPVAAGQTAAAEVPDLKPGEVSVDKDGNVIQG